MEVGVEKTLYNTLSLPASKCDTHMAIIVPK